MITYLYIKTHNTTGLKYFGKTTQNPFTYNGSGKYWKKHLKKHGVDLTTTLLGAYEDVNECEIAALTFSRDHDIVNSPEWANLIEENGQDGAPNGHPGHKFTDEQLKALSQTLKERWADTEYRQRLSDVHRQRWANGDLKQRQSKRLKEEFWTDERKAAHSAKLSGRPASEQFLRFAHSKRSEDHKAAISNAMKGKSKSDEHKQKLKKPKPLVVCRIEDRKLMAIGNFMNWLKRVTSAGEDNHSKLP